MDKFLKKISPGARAGHTAATVQTRIHAGGGEDVDIGETFAGHWVYDPAADGAYADGGE